MRRLEKALASGRLGCCLLGMLLPVPAGAQTNAAAVPVATNLTVSDAEAIALKNHPRVTTARLLALAQGQVTREVRSAELPTVTGSLTAVQAHDGGRVTAGFLNNPVLYTRAAGGVTVSQLITDFGRTQNLVASAGLREKAQQSDAMATEQDIRLAVDAAFYRALAAQAVVNVAKKTVAFRQDNADLIGSLASAKLKSTLDQSFADVNLNQAKLLLLDAQNEQDASFADLSTVMGYERQQSIVLVDDAKGELAAPAQDVDSLTALAMRSRPDLAALDDQFQATERFRKAEHDLWRPTISALGTAGGAPVRADEITSSWYGAAGVNISVPVFNGGLNSARAKEADYRADAAREQARELRNRIARDVRVSWLSAQSAYERMSVTAKLLAQANQALDLAQTRYKLGLSSIVELSQAELAQTSAEIGNTNARYDYQQSLAAIRYQTGQ
ncbi:TolC family protein [Edaphobacter aggregans]|uniref:TolC family protein n=1 Tax=Edaphobacter aggregans TaxID=570835 RepID=UPI000555D70C|nr:TolC family protein [Edaphobacter aggregans]